MRGSFSMMGCSSGKFRIEHAQRIGLDAALAVRAELVFTFSEFAAQQLDVLRAALFVADGIDEERGAP